MFLKKSLVLILCVTFYSCNKYEEFKPIPSLKTIGYIPDEIVNKEQALIVKLEKPNTVKEIGKTQIIKDILFISEYKKGLHVFDNKNPSSPKNILFISIPTITDFIVKDGVIIATNANDIIAINSFVLVKIVNEEVSLGDIFKSSPFLQVEKRLENLVNFPNYPDSRNTYFQCPDSLGYVLSWKIDSSKNSISCYR